MIAALVAIAIIASQNTPAPQQTPHTKYEWGAAGFKLYQEKKYSDAATAYQMAIKLGDKRPSTYYNLACCFALDSKKDDAFLALTSGDKAGFYDSHLLETDTDMESLRSDPRWAAIVETCHKNESDRSARMGDPKRVKIDISSLEHFHKAYFNAEKADPKDRGRIYQQQYIDSGNAPLNFMLTRAGMNGDKFAKMIDSHSKYFASITNIDSDFTKQANILRDEFTKFKQMYPAAIFPDVYVMIGGFNSGGTTNEDGLLVGAEMFGKTPTTPMTELGPWEQRVLAPTHDFVPLAVHESVHYQQKYPFVNTLLSSCIKEGAADFVSYLVTGEMMERTRNLHLWANPREREIWQSFAKEMDGKSTKGWLYGDPREGWPDDVGYWIGFKICESYYGRAEDKMQALNDILNIKDFKAFFAASKYAEKFGDKSPQSN